MAAIDITRTPESSTAAGSLTPRSQNRWRWLGWLLPAVVLTGLFTVYPGISAARLSLYTYAGYGEKTWVGFRNYQTLWTDKTFTAALWHTAQFAVVTAVGTVLVGFLIAVHLNRNTTYTRVVKAAVFLPVILPVVFTGLVWVFGLDANFGWINSMLAAIDPDLAQAWLSNPRLVMWTIEFVTILQFSGLPMIIVLAALQDIPAEVQEAASLDGVSPFQRLRLITLPLIKDVLLSVLLLQLMYGFKVFDQVFVMTRGGPGSQVASTYVYRNAFQLQHFGLGAAGAVVTCLIVVVVSMAYVSVFRPGRIGRG